jgi:hypothetical protein
MGAATSSPRGDGLRYRSLNSIHPGSIIFRNLSMIPVQTFWHAYNGDERGYFVMQPGEHYRRAPLHFSSSSFLFSQMPQSRVAFEISKQTFPSCRQPTYASHPWSFKPVGFEEPGPNLVAAGINTQASHHAGPAALGGRHALRTL